LAVSVRKMNEIEKPDKCQESGCNNKAYTKDYLFPNYYCWVCKKHHYMYNYGYGENEASKK